MSQPERTDWKIRAQGGYERLGWVKNPDLLTHLVDLADIQGNETIIDIGTGSQAVLDAVAARLSHGRVFGFDISSDMMAKRDRELPRNAGLFVADAIRLPVPSNTIDRAFARMVYHHIPKAIIPAAVAEVQRVVRSGGKFLVCEYVATDDNVWVFEREVFDIKEPERNLWTQNQVRDIVQVGWQGFVYVECKILEQYSVKDWLGKSGLPIEKQDRIRQLYLNAPPSIREAMNITITDNEDALVDRQFAYVVASSNK